LGKYEITIREWHSGCFVADIFDRDLDVSVYEFDGHSREEVFKKATDWIEKQGNL